MIPQRIRVAAALAITVGCGSVQVASGLSGEPLLPSKAAPVIEADWPVWIPDPLPTVTHLPIESTTTTTTVVLPATLSELIDRYFDPADRAWALRVAFCESSAQPGDTTSTAHHSGSGASGWFQHLPKFWVERSSKAGVAGASIMEPETNVLVAAWLLYETPQGKGHWNESKHCWQPQQGKTE
jgi:hypothetical protein